MKKKKKKRRWPINIVAYINIQNVSLATIEPIVTVMKNPSYNKSFVKM